MHIAVPVLLFDIIMTPVTAAIVGAGDAYPAVIGVLVFLPVIAYIQLIGIMIPGIIVIGENNYVGMLKMEKIQAQIEKERNGLDSNYKKTRKETERAAEDLYLKTSATLAEQKSNLEKKIAKYMDETESMKDKKSTEIETYEELKAFLFQI